MKITESYIRKIIKEELSSLVEDSSFNLSPEDKGVLMAVGQALEKALDTVSRYTNIDDENESTHDGVIEIQSLLGDALTLQQRLLNGESEESPPDPDDDESTKVLDEDLRFISFALRPDATDEERKIASEKLDQIIGQTALHENKINEVKEDIVFALANINNFIKKSSVDDAQKNELSSHLVAIMQELHSLEKSLGQRGKEVGYVVPGTSPSNPVIGDPSKRVVTTAEGQSQ